MGAYRVIGHSHQDLLFPKYQICAGVQRNLTRVKGQVTVGKSERV